MPMKQNLRSSRRVAFFVPRNWPLANTRMVNAFRDQFSDFEVDVFNIEHIVLKRPDILFLNSLATLYHYGLDMMHNARKFKDSFWRTPFIFNFIKRWIKKYLSRNQYCFTFQMQSIFDCSIDGIPHFVYTDHTHLENKEYRSFNKEKLYPPYWIKLEKQIYDHATLNFVRSTNIKRSLEVKYNQPEDKVICVFAGSNVDSAIISEPENRYEKKNILFVGIDWMRKGGPTLIAAFKSIKSAFPDATLTIVGCKPDIDDARVNIVGKISPEELKQYYIDASIFCMPTNEEPFGIAFLEAMQSSLPIIGTNVGAIPDFVQVNRNGFLVQPDDIKGVADALSRLLSNPGLCESYGANSKKIAEENYTWNKVCEKLSDHILKLLKNNHEFHC